MFKYIHLDCILLTRQKMQECSDLTAFVSRNDEQDVLETCRELNIKINT